MQLLKVDPRALKENPDRTRQTKSTPQADALLLATIKAVGIVQPPVITPESGGGNGYVTLGLGTRRWDTTLIASQFGYAPDTSFAAAARQTYELALARDGKAAAKLVKERFAARGIVV